MGCVGVAVTAGGVALGWRWPWPGLVLVAAGPLTASWSGADPLAVWSLAVFALFGLAWRGLPALPGGLLLGAANIATVSISGLRPDGWATLAVLSGVVALAASFGGAALRQHRMYWIELLARADDALATRDAEAERRVAEERLRIARDLHDVVGHEIALVSMNVGAAEVHLAEQPDAAKADLAAARARIKSVLAETQQVLTLLRQGAGQDAAPAAGLEQITNLVGSFRAAGLDIDAQIGELPSRADTATSAAAYRIAQEALTNAQRHGQGECSLRIAWDRQLLRIEATNRKAPNKPGGPGLGLIGLRERAASAGGRIDVDEDESLFTLRATLPLPESGAPR
jgi:signal transduction histidine kinase